MRCFPIVICILFSTLPLHTCTAQFIVAHRGASHDAPENTLAAFELAWQRGADAIEGDFYLTSDGKIVCIHDKTTKRVAPKHPELTVTKSTFDQLRKLEVGSWKDAKFSGQQIPTLKEVLAIVPPGKRIFVEIKSGPEIVPTLTTELNECGLQPNQIVIIAFNEDVVRACRKSMPQFKCSWLTSFRQKDKKGPWKPGTDEVVSRLQQSGATGLGANGNEAVINGNFADRVRQTGSELHVWTINDLDAAKRFVKLGVDSITTDRPALIRQALPQPADAVSKGDSLQNINVACEGTYPHHLQGIAADDSSLYWSFTTTLVKTNKKGELATKVPVANHHGDLCYRDGKLYVAVNLGKFNDPAGNADSWIYVYDAQTLQEIARHETQEVEFGAGGIGFRKGNFFVIGGLPADVHENYVYEYDEEFNFIKRHVIKSGHTLMGIQTATFANDRWWFGCYGAKSELVVTDSEFQFLGRHPFNCSLGIQGYSKDRLLSASGNCVKNQGCRGSVRVAVPDQNGGLMYAKSK
ncbi:glycerophosphodiester phosphodiesterase [Stieleria marina]|uniref:Putative glycerophosphoryl diester phosphodiesterase 1 n=1 Tax=Stieleria marina TaxID=1930275 RepID=A0A517NVF7_9BACT|nr:putative glycerophosphoryl diester phosphodiesterase 1 [Planctomycetes bacterium K23_9]